MISYGIDGLTKAKGEAAPSGASMISRGIILRDGARLAKRPMDRYGRVTRNIVRD